MAESDLQLQPGLSQDIHSKKRRTPFLGLQAGNEQIPRSSLCVEQTEKSSRDMQREQNNLVRKRLKMSSQSTHTNSDVATVELLDLMPDVERIEMAAEVAQKPEEEDMQRLQKKVLGKELEISSTSPISNAVTEELIDLKSDMEHTQMKSVTTQQTEEKGKRTPPMNHAKTIEEHLDVLVRCTNIDDHLIACLRAAEVLNRAELSTLEAETSLHKRCCLLFNWLKERRHSFESLLEVMEENEQQHVSNLLKGQKDGPHMPLSWVKFSRLEKITPKLLFAIHNSEDLIARLKRKRAITQTEYEALRLDIHPNFRKNSILINAILRRSEYSFACFEKALRKTSQEHVANYLTEGETIDVHINTNHDELDSMLSQAITRVEPGMSSLLKQLKHCNVKLVEVKQGKYVSLSIDCSTAANKELFKQNFNDQFYNKLFGEMITYLWSALNPKEWRILGVTVCLFENVTGGDEAKIDLNINLNQGESNNIPLKTLYQALCSAIKAFGHLDTNGLRVLTAYPGHSIVLSIYSKNPADMIKFTKLFNSGHLKEMISEMLNSFCSLIDSDSIQTIVPKLSLDEIDIAALEDFTGVIGVIPCRKTCLNSRPSVSDRIDDLTRQKASEMEYSLKLRNLIKEREMKKKHEQLLKENKLLITLVQQYWKTGIRLQTAAMTENDINGNTKRIVFEILILVRFILQSKKLSTFKGKRDSYFHDEFGWMNLSTKLSYRLEQLFQDYDKMNETSARKDITLNELPNEILDKILVKAVSKMMATVSQRHHKRDQSFHGVGHPLRTVSSLWNSRLTESQEVKIKMRQLKAKSNHDRAFSKRSMALQLSTEQHAVSESTFYEPHTSSLQKLPIAYDSSLWKEPPALKFYEYLEALKVTRQKFANAFTTLDLYPGISILDTKVGMTSSFGTDINAEDRVAVKSESAEKDAEMKNFKWTWTENLKFILRDMQLMHQASRIIKSHAVPRCAIPPALSSTVTIILLDMREVQCESMLQSSSDTISAMQKKMNELQSRWEEDHRQFWNQVEFSIPRDVGATKHEELELRKIYWAHTGSGTEGLQLTIQELIACILRNNDLLRKSFSDPFEDRQKSMLRHYGAEEHYATMIRTLHESRLSLLHDYKPFTKKPIDEKFQGQHQLPHTATDNHPPEVRRETDEEFKPKFLRF